MTKPIKDVAASVRQRLQNVARDSAKPFQEVLQYFAMERFLYRLSISPHAQRFILKGGLMFRAWQAPASRATKDIDLLGRMTNTTSEVVLAIQEICRQAVEPDGIVFDPETIEGEVIKEDADYEGVRVTFRATLQNARVAMQIDLGFGDIVTPAPIVAEYPTILDFPAPRLAGYPKETVIAEKFEAMVKLGVLNSRMKDFFDIWLLASRFDFDGATLSKAVVQTFAHRGTPVEREPFALTTAFASDSTKRSQWQGFLRKARLEEAPQELQEVIDSIGLFLLPVAAAAAVRNAFDQFWNGGGPWQRR